MQTLKKFLGIALALVIFDFPFVGYLYILLMLTAGAVAFFTTPSPGWAVTVLQYGWRVYLASFVVTLIVMTTFFYQNCCVRMQTFRAHLKHAGSRHWEVLEVAVLWPHGWIVVSHNMGAWGMTWMDIVFGVIEYWTVTIWKGVRIESINFRSGKREVRHSKSPEQTWEIIREDLKRHSGHDEQ